MRGKKERGRRGEGGEEGEGTPPNENPAYATGSQHGTICFCEKSWPTLFTTEKKWFAIFAVFEVGRGGLQNAVAAPKFGNGATSYAKSDLTRSCANL